MNFDKAFTGSGMVGVSNKKKMIRWNYNTEHT